MTPVFGALAVGAFAGLIVVAGYAATPALLAAAIALTVIVMAVGWGPMLALPARRGTALLISVIGCGGAVVAVRTANSARPLAPFSALMAGAVLIAFVHELSRRAGRTHLVESVTGTLSGETLALLGGGWMLLPGTRLGLCALATGAAAAVGARLASLLPVGERLTGWVSVVCGTLVGWAVGSAVASDQTLPLLAVAGVVACVVAGLDRLLLSLAQRSSAPVVLAGAAAPVLAVGTVAYAVARLVA